MDRKTKRKNSGYQDEKEKIHMLEKSGEELKEQLSIARTESDAKDELLNKQGHVAQEAIFGWNKAESEVISLKQQISSLSNQKSQIEQNFSKLKQEKDEIFNETLQNLSKIKDLEENLTESNDKVLILTMENKNIYSILETKETIIQELNESNEKASLVEIRARFSACEKENSNLKYELCMVQKELEIRNKERDYNIKTAEAAYKQQMESLKRVSQLENECNKLRNMVRKRLPGPNAIAKMRNEVENLGTNSNNGTEIRRKKSNPNPLVTKLHVIEEENRVLKETLARKNCEDTMSCAESWASALITELENYKSEKIGPNSNFGFEGDHFENCPSWLKDIVKVIIEKHYVIQKSVEGIIEEVIVALKESGFYTKEEKENCKLAPESAEIDIKPSEEVKSGFVSVENGLNDGSNVSMKNCAEAPEKMKITEKFTDMDESNKETNEINETENNEIGKNNEKMDENEIEENESNIKFEKEMKEEELNNRSLTQKFEFESKSLLENDNVNISETFVPDQDEKQLRTESEIISSTENLTNCQEIILNLNKQLEEISEQKNTSISNKLDTSSSTFESTDRSFTLSQIIAEEKAQLQNSNEMTKSNDQSASEFDDDLEKDEGSVPLAVPKRQKVSFFGRLVFGKKEKKGKA